ncbi:hypothetical protein [Cohnella cholangitidis]|uniref:Uncharacterized protein n=1 Tax=Cohnella cholangitidis TaxID=2598458 RepID=A0A7G5BX96_9BACL|nr:hypothetical protein [Cohnella cholangitidis]QMV41580.1 hypothetical protein FPL14_10585 [Cohnella cholangitidis]
MRATMGFSLRYYTRSYRYVAPLLIFGLSLYFIYSVVPNPVMPSYSFTATLLFVVSAWLSFSYIDVEDETQQQITVMHIGNLSKYYISKLLVMVIIVSALSIMCVLYPIAFDKFVRQPNAAEIVVSIISHVSLSLLGMSVSLLFTNKLVQKLGYAILGLFMVIALSLAGAGIESALPEAVRPMAWVIPPISHTMEMLNHYEEATYGEITISLLAPLIYSLLLFWVFLVKMKKSCYKQ